MYKSSRNVLCMFALNVICFFVLGTPEIGGLTTIQALEIVRGLRGLNIVGCDLVEVYPKNIFLSKVFHHLNVYMKLRIYIHSVSVSAIGKPLILQICDSRQVQ